MFSTDIYHVGIKFSRRKIFSFFLECFKVVEKLRTVKKTMFHVIPKEGLSYYVISFFSLE